MAVGVGLWFRHIHSVAGCGALGPGRVSGLGLGLWRAKGCGDRGFQGCEQSHSTFKYGIELDFFEALVFSILTSLHHAAYLLNTWTSHATLNPKPTEILARTPKP